jgi:hypothetical protein
MAETIGMYLLHRDLVKTTITTPVKDELVHTDLVGPVVEAAVEVEQTHIAGVAVPDGLQGTVKVGPIGAHFSADFLQATENKFSEGVRQGRDIAQVEGQAAINRLTALVDPMTLLNAPKPQNMYTEEKQAGEYVSAFADTRMLNVTVKDANPTAFRKKEEQRASFLKSHFDVVNKPQLIDALGTLDDPLRHEFKRPRAWHITEGANDDIKGYFEEIPGVEATVPTDHQVYVPLVFTDLRTIGGGKFRSVYFKPYISSLSEDFAPEWDTKSYYGRVDPVA